MRVSDKKKNNHHRIIIAHVHLDKGWSSRNQQTILLIKSLSDYPVTQKLIVAYGSVLHKSAPSQANLEVIAIHRPYSFHLSEVEGVDLMHAHDWTSALFCYKVKKLFFIPYIFTEESIERQNNKKTKLVYENATCVIALSKAIHEVLHSILPQLSVERIPSMANTKDFDIQEADRLKHKYKGKYVVGHVGRLDTKTKGQQFIIEAARLLLPRYPQIHFIIIGNGSSKAKLKKQAERLENVEFISIVSESCEQNYLAICELYVQPSLQHGFSNALLNAMSLRIPVIATNVGGLVDLVQDGITGVLVPARSADAIAEAVENVYTSVHLADSIGQQGYNLAKKYSEEKISNQIFLLYRSVLSRHN